MGRKDFDRKIKGQKNEEGNGKEDVGKENGELIRSAFCPSSFPSFSFPSSHFSVHPFFCRSPCRQRISSAQKARYHAIFSEVHKRLSMRIAGLALTLFTAAFLLHWIVWRIRIPRRQSAVILAILLAALPVGLAAVTFLPFLRHFRPTGLWEVVQVCAFHISMSLGYVVAYSAIESRSPSMSLLTCVADARGEGRTQAELQSVLRGEDPVAARLQALLRDRLVDRDDAGFVLTSKGWAWARCFGSFRNLLAMSKGG
jgi:hypothetical protein